MRINKMQITPEALRALAEQLEVAGGAAKPVRKRTTAKKGGRPKDLTRDELELLFAAIRKHGSPRDMALFEVAYHRGLRASEVGLLTFGHLRLAQRRLRVERLKNGNGAEYPLCDRELRALKAWLRVRGNDPGPLFWSRNHKAIGRRRLDQLMKRYGELAGLPADKRHFHCLRHSCATQLVEHEVDVLTIQDHLGHADIRNTTIYTRVGDRTRRKVAEALADKW